MQCSVRDSIEEKESMLGWSITLAVVKIVDVVIGRTVREEHEQQKKLIDRMILDINVLNAVCNLERISTIAMILVTVLLGIAMIYITKNTMGKRLIHNNTDNDNNSP